MPENHANCLPANLPPSIKAKLDAGERLSGPLFAGQGFTHSVGSDSYGGCVVSIAALPNRKPAVGLSPPTASCTATGPKARWATASTSPKPSPNNGPRPTARTKPQARPSGGSAAQPATARILLAAASASAATPGTAPTPTAIPLSAANRRASEALTFGSQ